MKTWENGFSQHGYQTHICDDWRKLYEMLGRLQPDILFCDIVSSPIETEEFRSCLTEARRAGTKICLSVFWPLLAQPSQRADALRHFDIADLYYGEREEDSMSEFVKETGKCYVTIAHAANPNIHFKVNAEDKYRCDLVFVGGKLQLKRWFNEELLPKLKRRYDVRIHGPGWTVQDNLLRAASKLFRMGKLLSMSRRIDRHRFPIPDSEISKVYNSAKIALNFHEREADGMQPHHVVSQRTFHIAACGAFQISDPVKAINRYFPSGEIIRAELDSKDWIEKIDFYLRNDDARRELQNRAMARAKNEHMVQHRVAFLLKLLAASASRS
ncbi:MAG TPA: glycosyltransferase [Opitutaceae bacterium]|nr:glycosyltransferase [Opitutaceae bacterium]